MTYKYQWMIDFFSNLLEEKKKEENDRDVAEIKKAIQVIKNMRRRKMPRLAPSRTEMMDRQFKAAYMAGLELKGLKTKNIASLIGKCEKTVAHKRDHPADMTVFELRAIADKLDFTAEQVASMILKA